MHLIEDSEVYHQHNAIDYDVIWHLYSKSSKTEMTDCKEYKEYGREHADVCPQSAGLILKSYYRNESGSKTNATTDTTYHIIFFSAGNIVGKIVHKRCQHDAD